MTFTAYASEPDPPIAAAVRVVIPSPWANPAVVERLKEIWPTHSASQICGVIWDQFGVHLSRNAVVGKLHRLGIGVEAKTDVHPLTSLTLAPRPGRPMWQRPKRERVIAAPRPVVPRPRREAPELIALRCAEIEPLGLALVDLERGQCRYPTNDSDSASGHIFCGHAVVTDRPYCSGHLALTTRGPR